METICEIIEVSKKYAGNQVLDRVNLTINKGEMIAVMGKSGSGKTTLLNIIGMLEKPDHGTIKLFGKDISRITSSEANKILRSKIAFLFQNFALIDNETIDKNLEIPLIYLKKSRKEKQESKKRVLEKVGLQVSLKQKVYELSGGEQQRLAIARILLKQHELVLADEPTGSLDNDNRNEIISLLKQLKDNSKAIIIVTHDPCVANECDRVIELM